MAILLNFSSMDKNSFYFIIIQNINDEDLRANISQKERN